MKYITLVLGLLLAYNVNAQNPYNMSQQDMEKMMQGMNKMQECMKKVDQSALEKMKVRSEEFQDEVKALCSANKRDQAQDKALEFAKEMMQSKDMKQMQQCAKMAEGMMKTMPFNPEVEDYENKHVCDI